MSGIQYSGSNLPEDHPDRHYKAKEVRRQVQEAPSSKTRYVTDDGKRQKTSYPKDFKNKDSLDLRSPAPRNEFPLSQDHQGNFSQRPVSQQPGPYRAIYAKDKTDDRSRFDLIYHDPTKTGGDDSNMSMAAYRDRQHRSSGGGEGSSRRTKTSSTLTERQYRLRSK